METQANTIWTKAYTPAGFQVGITIGFEAGNLPLAVDIDRRLQEAGYLLTLPGLEAGETAEPILYVCRYDHVDKKSGELIPHIAFYSQEDHLTKRWLHIYLDTQEQIEAFETATGVKVATMPIWNADTHPERNNPKAKSCIVRLAKPIRVARETYTNKEGETRHKFKRYVDSIGTPQPVTTGNTQAAPSETQGNNIDLSWEKQVFDATGFLYDHPTHQTNSINALLKNEVIKNTDTPVVSIMEILFHRAQSNYGLTADECKELLGAEVEGTVKEFMKSVNGSYKAAWDVIVASQTKPQATGTDDIPF